MPSSVSIWSRDPTSLAPSPRLTRGASRSSRSSPDRRQWQSADASAKRPCPSVTLPVTREVNDVIRAQIVGATGYGGVGMVELLLRHPEIRLTSLLAVSDVGKPLSAFYPHLRGYCDHVVEEAKPERVGQDADLVIFSTPDRVGMGYARGLVDGGMRVLDYSGD